MSRDARDTDALTPRIPLGHLAESPPEASARSLDIDSDDLSAAAGTLTMNVLPIGVVLYDKSGDVTYMNETAKRIFAAYETSPESDLSMRVASGNPRTPEGAALRVEDTPLYRALHHGESVSDFVVMHPRPHHDASYLSIGCEPVSDRNGAIVGAITVLQEITDIRRTYAKLKESEQRFRALVTASSEVLYRMSPDWSEMRQLHGHGFLADTDEPSGAWLNAYIHPDDQAQVIAAIEEAVRTRSMFQLEHRVHRADGTLGWTYSRAVPLFDVAGEITEWFGAARDITAERVHAQALFDADRRKNEFIAMLAHELRNPLASIQSSVQLLERVHGNPSSDPVVRQANEVLSRQVHHLSRLVHDLLDVSRIAQQTFTLRRERVVLRDVIERAMELSAPQSEDSGREVSLALPRAPVILEGDPVRLTQVFANLLDNAIKYSTPGTRIAIVAETVGSDVTIAVRDSGIGISAELLPHVFDVFQRGEVSEYKVQHGLGLGLTLVRRLVELHHGTVEIRSEGPGKGSEVLVRLPIACLGTDVESSSAAPSAVVPRRQRILLVDDNRDVADSMGMLLKAAGFEVQVAYEGLVALEMLSACTPGVALIDIGMAPIDGLEVARRIRSQERYRDVCLIAITGWGTDEDRQRSLDAGFDHHLTKPIGIRDLQALLHSL